MINYDGDCKIFILFFAQQQIEINKSRIVEGITNSSDFVGGVTLNFKDGFTILFFSLIAGFLVRQIYIKYSNSFSSTSSYGNSLLMVTVSVASLIAVVKSSLALSLGLVGALSVIRFRTAVKEPYTLSFILLSVCLGIAIGANQYLFALLVGIAGFFIAFFTNKKSTQLKTGEKSSTNEIDSLSILGENHGAILKALESCSKSLNTYSIKTISNSIDSKCSATVGVYVQSNIDLSNLINDLSQQEGILNVTFYNSPI